MAVLIPRSRTIGVRLSLEEYESLERFCVETRARSMSDLARNAILNHISRASRESGVFSDMNQEVNLTQELGQELARITSELTRLKSRIQSQDGNRTRRGRRESG